MSPHDRPACEEIFRRLDAYLDRVLAPREAAQVEDHLRDCAVCAAEFRFEEKLIDEIRGKLSRLSTSEELLARIRQQLRAAVPPAGG